jgi:hypothetical protein
MSVGTTVGNSDGPADCNIDGRRDGASDGTKVGVSDGLLDIVGRGDVDGVTVDEGVLEGAALGRAVGMIDGNSDSPIDGETDGSSDMDGDRDGTALSTIAFGNSTGAFDGNSEGMTLDGETDGAGETLISPHVPHVKSLRTLGYSIQVVRHSAVPAVPLYINQPFVKSTHPSGTGLHGPANSDGKLKNKLPKPRNRLPNSPSSSSSPATNIGDPTINSSKHNVAKWDRYILRIILLLCIQLCFDTF